jgi:hypothetical protein
MAGISAREYQARLAPLLKLSAIEDLVGEEMVKQEGRLLELKREEFTLGVRPTGSPIGYYRNKAYENRKRRLNPLARGRVDLMLTGAFIDSFYLLRPSTQKKTGSLFGARDKKRNSLVEKYGKDIMSLNEDVLVKLSRDIVIPRLRRTIKQRFRIG